MITKNADTTSDTINDSKEDATKTPPKAFYYIQHREGQPWQLATSLFEELPQGTVVMVETDHGLEPATIMAIAPITFSLPMYTPHCVTTSNGNYKQENNKGNNKANNNGKRGKNTPPLLEIISIAGPKEIELLGTLHHAELKAFKVCKSFVEEHQLNMKLVRVEQFYNKSKMVFYFTAESRVDFRALVKDLVQKYHTRIEMRQIGVRHETKMIGGLGICGRELCCAKYLHNFASVSVKMAKEQDLPLNPNKISGLCNRLFCCLTHEYESYKKARKKMPRIGWRLAINGTEYTVVRHNLLRYQVIAENTNGEEVCLEFEEWNNARPVKSKGGKAARPKKIKNEKIDEKQENPL